MGDSEFFDVPFCRVEKPSVCFSELNVTKDKATLIDEPVVTNPGLISQSQTKDRQKYTNKLIKQLKGIGVDVDNDTGLVASDSPVSHSDYFSDQEVDKTLLNIADETLDALSEQNMDADDDLAGWDPMKEAFEQKHFNSYQEPSYDAQFTEKHNPVRGTKISPAKGSEDEVSLYISNIPMNLTEDGLRNMFAKCGRCRRVKKCRPKISNSSTTFGFIAYSSVREAEEAITRYDRFQFGKDCELRVRLSHKERNVGFVPNEIDIQLGKENNSGSDNADMGTNVMNAPQVYRNTKEISSPRDTKETSSSTSEILFPNMFTKQRVEKEVEQKTIKRGPRLYLQGLSVKTTNDQLQNMVSEIADCRDCCVAPPKDKRQYTTFGFVTVGSVDDAEKVIEHFNRFGPGRLKATYSQQSAKELGKEIEKTEEDEYYLKLFNDTNFPENNESPKCESNQDMSKPITEISTIHHQEEYVKSTLGNLQGFSALENAINLSSSEEKSNDEKPEDEVMTGCVSTPNKEPDFLEESMISSITKYSYIPIESLSKCGPESSSTRISAEIPDSNLTEQNNKKPEKSFLNSTEKQKFLQCNDIQVTEHIDSSDQIVENVKSVSLPELELLDQNVRQTNDPDSEQNSLEVTGKQTEEPSQNIDGQTNEFTAQRKTENFVSNNLVKFTVSSIPSNIQPLELVVQKMLVQNLHSDFYNVNITHIETPHLIYGVLVDSKSNMNSQLERVLSDMTTFYSDTKRNLEFNFRAGALTAVHGEGVWKRGMVTKIEDDFCNVFLIDSGIEIQCQQSQLHPLPKQFKAIPAQAIPMKLFNIKTCDDKTEWPVDVITFLREFFSQQSVSVKPEFKDRMVFAVRITFGEQSMDKLLEEKGFAKRFQIELPQVASNWSPQVKPDHPTRYNICDVMSIEKPPCKPFEGYITFALSPKLFYCRSLEKSKDLKVDEIEKELKLHFQCDENTDDTDIVISAGQLCTAKLDDEHWYRGFVWKLYSDSAKVWLVDYGTTHCISLDCVHPLPEKYQSFPAQSMKSQLQYVAPIEFIGYSEENCNRFKELVTKRVLIIKVVNSHENMFRVLLFDKQTGIDIGEQLVQEGQAKFIFEKGQQCFLERSSTDNAEVPQDAFVQRPVGLNTKHQQNPPFVDQDEKKSSPVPLRSPPRGILQTERNKKPPGRGIIFGRGMSLMKDHGLFP